MTKGHHDSFNHLQCIVDEFFFSPWHMQHAFFVQKITGNFDRSQIVSWCIWHAGERQYEQIPNFQFKLDQQLFAFNIFSVNGHFNETT